MKPENLFVTQRTNGEDWCKVLDFGIAKTDVSGSTAEGSVIGTVRYMAPEQLRDGASVGSVTDIYALGAVLYECLCGVSPHSGGSVEELMFKIFNEQPTPLHLRAPHVPAPLARAVQRALAKDPESRFADVLAFAGAIEPFSVVGRAPEMHAIDETKETVELEGTAKLRPKRVGRAWLPMVAAAGVAGFAGFVAIGVLAQYRDAPVANRAPVAVASTISLVSASALASQPVPRTEPSPISVPAPSASTPRPRSAAIPVRRVELAQRPSSSPALTRFDVENPYPQ